MKSTNMRVVDDNHSDVFMLQVENDDIYNIQQGILNKLQVNGGSPGKADQCRSKSTSLSPQRSKCGRPANPTPRHKRESHIKAEYKRRDKIQKGFETLKDLVPSLGESSQKESKSAKLLKTVEYCRQLKADNKSRQDEASALRAELEALGSQIHFIMKPLYDSYKRIVSVRTPAELYRTVVEWMKDQLSLTRLRPGVFDSLRKISTQTKIMDKPGELQQQALETVEELQQQALETVEELQQQALETVDGNTTNQFSHDQMETFDMNSSTSIPTSQETTSAVPSFDLDSLLSVGERNANNQSSILPPPTTTSDNSLFDGLDNLISDSLMNSLQGSEDTEEPMSTMSFSSLGGTMCTTAQSVMNVNPLPVTVVSLDSVFANTLPQTVLSDLALPITAISVDSVFSTTLPQTVHSDLPIDSIFCSKTSPVTMPTSMTTDCVSSSDYQTLTINSNSNQTDMYATTLQNLFKTL
ncbi:hypothetical protein KUTeg_007485 [Tegillarca granosa]|uniref:BHLH domain-containing protein n=1 Tax=Tegillarca granosa TaxID=220873 RepID=A0ABQ9FDE3_TEGGR|nr:hypothetical protein KUTeg_007485 [Tegillarca granosa]